MKRIHHTKLALAVLASVFVTSNTEAQTRTTITIRNDSTEAAELYVDDGGGRWKYKGTIRPGARPQTYTAYSGDEWGFSDPHARNVDIIRSVVVGRWGSSLTLRERDINHGGGGGGGGGGGSGQLIGREITVTNNSGDRVDVYSDHGHGWHKEGTLNPRDQRRFPAQPGEDWGINDPHQRGIDIIKKTTVKVVDMFPFLTINDRELGHHSPPPPPRPATRTVTVYNNSSQDIGIYSNDGRRRTSEGVVSAGRRRSFNGVVGEIWGADDPGRFGVNIVKSITVRSSGSNSISVSNRDLSGGGPPPPLPPPPGGGKVTVKFKNQSYSNVSISRKTGRFTKSTISSVGGGDSNTLRLTPGEVIVLHIPGKPALPIHYTVPNRSETYTFRFNY